MEFTAKSTSSQTQKTLNLTMYLTMVISLIIISAFAVNRVSDCNSTMIMSKTQAAGKFHYSLSDGSQVWSNRDFSLNETVCIAYPNPSLAQK
jgi:hypothetical protein